MRRPACSDYLFKLLLIGDSGVGKSCLLLRFAVSKTQKERKKGKRRKENMTRSALDAPDGIRGVCF